MSNEIFGIVITEKWKREKA